MEPAYAKISKYLSLLRDRHGVQICIKDFCGFIPLNKGLDEALQPFLAHTNPFCMYMKSDQEHYRICLGMIRRMYQKGEQLKAAYFGMCHAGLGEYVVPIFDGSVLLGSINAGFFQENEARTRNRIERTCRHAPALDSRQAEQLYHTCIAVPEVDVEEMLAGLELMAAYLGEAYHGMRSADPSSGRPLRCRASGEDAILSHAVSYIRQHADSRITVPAMANFCYCSESYLSRIFKNRTGVNISEYIGMVRMELAKKRLLATDESIAEIALSTGFSDPNYFSRVFSRIVGLSPTEFRRLPRQGNVK